jgi:hypothetical protein
MTGPGAFLAKVASSHKRFYCVMRLYKTTCFLCSELTPACPRESQSPLCRPCLPGQQGREVVDRVRLVTKTRIEHTLQGDEWTGSSPGLRVQVFG